VPTPDPAGATDPLFAHLAQLPDRGKEPNSAAVLERWVAAAQLAAGVEAGRLGWLVASTVVIAALQRAVDETGRSHFLLKGGTYLQYRLGSTGRTTKDVDGLIRGDLDEFFSALDVTLRQPWGPLTLTRTEAEVIAAGGKVIKPRRFWVKLSLRGKVWRSIKVEVAADKADAASEYDVLSSVRLSTSASRLPSSCSGSRCVSRSPRSSMPAPTRTTRRMNRTIAPVTSPTCSCFATSSASKGSSPRPSWPAPAQRYSTHVLRRPPYSGELPVPGHLWWPRIRTGRSTTSALPVNPASPCPCPRQSPRSTRGSRVWSPHGQRSPNHRHRPDDPHGTSMAGTIMKNHYLATSPIAAYAVPRDRVAEARPVVRWKPSRVG
jgi:hypothetical protein